MKKITFFLCLTLLLFAAPAMAEDYYISDQSGHVGSCEDAQIGESTYADRNYGGGNYLTSGTNALGAEFRILQRYDLSTIPDDSEIIAVEIVLNCFQVNGSGEDVYCYQVADANNDWVEGTSNNATEVGANCWNDHTYQNTQEWAGSAGLNTATTDYINIALANVNVTGTGTKTWTLNISGLAAVQNRLVDNNIEFLFFSSPGGANDGVYFSSSESATESYKPYLHIVTASTNSIMIRR